MNGVQTCALPISGKAGFFHNAAVTDFLRLFDLGDGRSSVANREEEFWVFFAACGLMSPIHGSTPSCALALRSFLALSVRSTCGAQPAHKWVILPLTRVLNKKEGEKISDL